MSVKIAINGFGRVGRQVLKAMLQKYPDLEVVAINDITDVKTNAHLFKYDSNYGTFPGEVKVDGDYIVIDGKRIKSLKEKDPANLPWGELGVHTVIESTGIFKDGPTAAIHIKRGAKKVIITAPTKLEDKTVCMGVNEKEYDPEKHHVISKRLVHHELPRPVAKVLNDKFGIGEGPDDHHPRVHERSAHPRPAPQGPPQGKSGRAQHHPHHHGRCAGSVTGHPRAERQVQRLRPSRPPPPPSRRWISWPSSAGRPRWKK